MESLSSHRHDASDDFGIWNEDEELTFLSHFLRAGRCSRAPGALISLAQQPGEAPACHSYAQSLAEGKYKARSWGLKPRQLVDFEQIQILLAPCLVKKSR